MNRHEFRAALAQARKGHGKKSAKVRRASFSNRLTYVRHAGPVFLSAFLKGRQMIRPIQVESDTHA